MNATLAAVVALTAVAIAGVVAVFLGGGDGSASTITTIIGFAGTSVAGLLAFNKASDAKETSQRTNDTVNESRDAVQESITQQNKIVRQSLAEQQRNAPEQVRTVVEQLLAEKSIVDNNDLPKSLGGNKE